MYRCARIAIAAVLTMSVFVAAIAQTTRVFPQNALRGAMVFGSDRQVTLNGRLTQLSPGSRVRDQNNMIVQTGSLAGAKLLVHYTLDLGETQVRDVWVLTPDEAAIRPWPTTLDEAQSWSYDATTMSWSKP